MIVLAAGYHPYPYGVAAWVIIGLTLGLLARLTLRRGNRLGVAGDLVFGLMGALVGGAPVGFATREMEGVIGSGLTAFAGAVTAIALGRLVFVAGKRP